MPGRNSQVARILCLLDILDQATAGLTVKDLWQRLKDRKHETELRTIYRDLDALSASGFPLFQEGDDKVNQRWRLDRKAKINEYLKLTARELFALFLARGVLVPLRDTPFYQDLQSIFQKLEEKMGLKNTEYFQSLEQELKFEPGPQWGLGLDPDVLETVRAACAEKQLISCDYFSVNSNKESRRKLGPHYLYYARGGLYLVAEDIGDKRVKIFAMPRMKTAELLDESYNGEVKTPEDLFNGSLGVFSGDNLLEVVIEFEANISYYVKERRWHSSQRVTNLEGGKIRVTLEVAETPELFSWILGFGANVRVISPTPLAEKVAVMAIETAKVYSKKVI